MKSVGENVQSSVLECKPSCIQAQRTVEYSVVRHESFYFDGLVVHRFILLGQPLLKTHNYLKKSLPLRRQNIVVHQFTLNIAIEQSISLAGLEHINSS